MRLTDVQVQQSLAVSRLPVFEAHLTVDDWVEIMAIRVSPEHDVRQRDRLELLVRDVASWRAFERPAGGLTSLTGGRGRDVR